MLLFALFLVDFPDCYPFFNIRFFINFSNLAVLFFVSYSIRGLTFLTLTWRVGANLEASDEKALMA